MDAVDLERQRLQRSLGLAPVSLPETIHRFFNVSGDTCYSAIRACPNYGSQTTPDNLQHRYLTEDVPYGLVPMISIGESLGLDMSVTRSVVTLASSAAGRDFQKEGRSLDAMGLTGMDATQMLRHVGC
jgi:opine dehydrogenase